ncbi:MAG: flagellar protein FlaG [Desulfobacterota bacterium]|nr:flagellar protein FlaG [Thermodesulfobacteriota bacterium]
MGDTFDINIRRVDESSSFKDQGRQRQEHEKKRQRKGAETAEGYVQEILTSIERAHALLAEKKSPFRFNVRREQEKVIIDIIMIDQGGGTATIIRKNITQQEFTDIIKNLETLDGMIIDLKA